MTIPGHPRVQAAHTVSTFAHHNGESATPFKLGTNRRSRLFERSSAYNGHAVGRARTSKGRQPNNATNLLHTGYMPRPRK